MKPDKTIDIYSEKYKTEGQILDFGTVIKLKFAYGKRVYTIGLSRPFQEELSDAGLQRMETTIEKLIKHHRKTSLHYWYIDDVNVAHGVATEHKKIPDATRIHTSRITGLKIDAEMGEAVLTTSNTVYYCPLSYCRFEKQDLYPDALPDYEALKERYKETIAYPEIEQGKVLLVIADFAEYYFHSLYVRDKNGKPLEYRGYPHTGTFQDSYIIEARCDEFTVDLRYYPHYKNIEFYSRRTNKMPLYAQNVGRSTIYIIIDKMQFSVAPGERKELTAENAEKDAVCLPDGDLYPAGTL